MTKPTPRGIANNNPGNIRRSSIAWKGEIDGRDPDFETFATPEEGIRAIAKILIYYYRKEARHSVDAMIGRWAPPVENDTGAYAKHAAMRLGVLPSTPLELTPRVLEQLVEVIVTHENGEQPYPIEMIEAAVASALSGA